MGTLGDQSPRTYFDINEENFELFLERIKFLATRYSMSVGNVIYAKEVLELQRTNNIKVEAGDYMDEQVGGFGDIARDLFNHIDDLYLRDLVTDIRNKLKS